MELSDNHFTVCYMVKDTGFSPLWGQTLVNRSMAAQSSLAVQHVRGSSGQVLRSPACYPHFPLGCMTSKL